MTLCCVSVAVGALTDTASSPQAILEQAEKCGGQYIGFFSEPPPASQETVSASIERLLVASTPWQEINMHARRIYRWESPKETFAYLVAFVILWWNGALCAAGVNLLPREWLQA